MKYKGLQGLLLKTRVRGVHQNTMIQDVEHGIKINTRRTTQHWVKFIGSQMGILEWLSVHLFGAQDSILEVIAWTLFLRPSIQET